MRRDPNRPKASDVPLMDLLLAVEEFNAGGPWIPDALPQYPAKVVIARLHKLVSQRLVQVFDDRGQRRYCLTTAGREAVNQ